MMNVLTHVCKSQLSSRRKLTVVSSSERADGSFSLALMMARNLCHGMETFRASSWSLVLRVITCYNN